MIIYATKQTMERYKIQPISELFKPEDNILRDIVNKEIGDEIFEWGAKIFYFDGIKCIQVVNFASKFTLFLFDIKKSEIDRIGTMILTYLFELYSEDRQMTKALEKMYSGSILTVFDKLVNKSMIATLNSTQSVYAEDGDRFYYDIEDGVLQTMKINHDVNFSYLFTKKINGKTEYIFPAELFRNVVVERFG